MRAPSSGGISQIQSPQDIETQIPQPPTPEEIDASGRFSTLQHLSRQYPDHHFSFQSSTPMVQALNSCGGFVEGLLTLATDRALFEQLLERWMHHNLAQLEVGRQAGGDSVWFTSYYTGADTISPQDYAALIFPYELEICRHRPSPGLEGAELVSGRSPAYAGPGDETAAGRVGVGTGSERL